MLETTRSKSIQLCKPNTILQHPIPVSTIIYPDPQNTHLQKTGEEWCIKIETHSHNILFGKTTQNFWLVDNINLAE